MRVLFVSHDTSMYGAQRVLMTLLENIDRTMFQPLLAVPYDGPMVGIATGIGIPVFVERMVHWIPGSLNATPRRRLGQLRRFLGTLRGRCAAFEELIRKEGVSLVCTNTITCAEGAIAARNAGVPHVWHIHEHLRNNQDLALLAPRKFYCMALDRLSTRIVCCSRALLEDYPLMPGKTRVIPNGIPDARNEDRSAARDRLGRDLGIGREDKVVAIIGRLQPAKDLSTFLEAAGRIDRSFGSAVYLVVGEGEEGYARALDIRIRELGLEGKVKLLGHREDARDILAAADVLAISSERESFGLTAVEAMAAGIPVVATRCGGPEEIVRDGETGFLVPVKDPAAMAAAIERLFRDPELAGRMGASGKRVYRERYGTDRFVREMEAVLREAVSGR